MAPPLHYRQGHIVLCALPEWGHTKALCALAAKIVRLRRVYITLFTGVTILDRVLAEVARQFATEGEENLRNLIRVVALPAVKFEFDAFQFRLIDSYKILSAEKAIPATPDAETLYEPISAPQAVVIDFFFYDALNSIRSATGHKVPVFAWQSGGPAAVLYLFAPEELGGLGDLAAKINNIKTEDEEERERQIVAIHRRCHGELVQIPGIPPMYDYEHVAQVAAIPMKESFIAFITQYCHRFLVECDGVVHNASRHFHGEELKVWQEWYGSKPVIAVGPLSPPASVAEIEKEKEKCTTGEGVEFFLNSALDKYGPNSVVYISFGTFWWPLDPEKLFTLLDVLIEQRIPFIMSHASPVAVIPEKVSAKIKASGLGYLDTWLPQQVILRHQACGWFMTHVGHNSVMESLTAGIPLICWPYEADQPSNAASITYTHEVGYELFEVRTGHGLRPIHRLGDKAPTGTIEAIRHEASELFKKARGEDGAKKRAKAQWFSEKFAQDWAEDGVLWKELEKLVDFAA